MSTATVSVIIPTFNRAHVLEQTLRSVVDQGSPVLEILVCDDGSTDGTVATAHAFGPPVRVLPIAENSGLPAVGRNRGLSAAQGDYIAFLDSDDFWKPGKLARQLEWFGQHPGLDMLHSYVELVDDDNRVLGVRHENSLPDAADLLPDLLRHCFISISSVIVRRRVVETIGLMSEDPFYRAREDYEWFLRVARDFRIGLIPEVLAAYRKSPTSISSDERTWTLRPEDAPMHLRIAHRPELWEGRVPAAGVRSIARQAFLENAQFWRGQHRPDRALWNALRALRLSPFSPTSWTEVLKSLARRILPAPPHGNNAHA